MGAVKSHTQMQSVNQSTYMEDSPSPTTVTDKALYLESVSKHSNPV